MILIVKEQEWFGINAANVTAWLIVTLRAKVNIVFIDVIWETWILSEFIILILEMSLKDHEIVFNPILLLLLLLWNITLQFLFLLNLVFITIYKVIV